MRFSRAAGFAATSVIVALGAIGLSACKLEKSTGYIEIRTVPANPPPHLKLILDSEALEPLKKGAAVLRQQVGTHKLAVAGSGDPLPLCELVVKKDRITTVTVSLLDRPPRCQCRAATGTDAASNKKCEG
ncbi:hypothetical protein CCR97_11575 [Rhodoplanes elegans]|uniref:Lipoprotein n=1 Tax=Rhodoplanes elegans TaxID=29408 RepID=A0A327KG45_9BRAD|nr:hypothetical protein [Rhodoplanes elegans]MBK5958842.1 hypothetical protein [Rhodoplanes elegans]RAI36545.1 hypothetical protein CH338_17445 [Rhodoplanes elegans]